MISATIALAVIAAQSATNKTPDLSTPNAVVQELYGVISGPAGKKRDPAAFKALFHETATMVSVSGMQNGKVRSSVISIQDYIDRSFPFLERNGFFETEIKNVTEIYGNVAHVFTTYESKNKKEDEKPFARGINSVQLMNDGERWWIMNIVWQNEVEGITIPKKYLPGG